jgi:hypothetical protein
MSNVALEEQQSPSADSDAADDVDATRAPGGGRITLWQAFAGRGPFGPPQNVGQHWHYHVEPPPGGDDSGSLAYPDAYPTMQTRMPSEAGTCTISPDRESQPSGSSLGLASTSDLEDPQNDVDVLESGAHLETAEEPARPPRNKGKRRATAFDLEPELLN